MDIPFEASEAESVSPSWMEDVYTGFNCDYRTFFLYRYDIIQGDWKYIRCTLPLYMEIDPYKPINPLVLEHCRSARRVATDTGVLVAAPRFLGGLPNDDCPCRLNSADSFCAPPTNVLVSPLLVVVALITFANAVPHCEVLRKLLPILGFQTLKDANVAAASMMNVFQVDGYRSPGMEVANSIWVDPQWVLPSSFDKVINAVSNNICTKHAVFYAADELISKINRWVEDTTRGAVNNMIASLCVQELRLVLVNAVNFRASCPLLEPDNTSDKHFNLLDGRQVLASSMEGYDKVVPYESFNEFELVELPLFQVSSGGQFSMLVFLPNEVDGLRKLVEKMCCEPRFFNLDFQLSKVNLNRLQIPKMRCSYRWCPRQSYGLQTDGVEFAQKVVVELTEHGSEESADEASMEDWSPSTIDFIADRPFMYAIKEKTNGCAVFVGIFVDPACTDSNDDVRSCGYSRIFDLYPIV